MPKKKKLKNSQIAGVLCGMKDALNKNGISKLEKQLIEKMKMSLVIFKQEILSLTGDLMTSANVKVVGLDKNNQLCNLTKIMSA